MRNGSLMKVESIAECSPWCICNTLDLHYRIIGPANQYWSTYDFSTLYTTLPHNLKINLLILLKEPSIEKALLTLHVTT